MGQIYLDIAISVPIRRSFDYLPPRDQHQANLEQLKARLKPGTRVKVPFGNRTAVGLLIQVKSTSSFATGKIKHALEILDDVPPLPSHLHQLAVWAARYYQHPIGEATLGLLPKLLRSGHAAALSSENYWQLSELGKHFQVGDLHRAKKQQQALAVIAQQQTLAQSQLKNYGISINSMRALEKKSLVCCHQKPMMPTDYNKGMPLLSEPHLALNSEQELAIKQVKAKLTQFAPFLLSGVTGSGKTEIYLQLIDCVLQAGKQVLVLVPEIGLTPQTTNRFKQRFNCHIVVLHSGLSDKARLNNWLLAAKGHANIIIGTRSALFTPLLQPGLIIVDEEHDASFKQQEGFRYSARDLSIMRAKAENTPIVLASATPSLESFYNAAQGRFHLLRLTQRAGGAAPPRFTLLNIRGAALRAGMSEELISAIARELDNDNQVILFLNRRGFAPALLCHHCGWVAECPSCDARFTVHYQANKLRCHYCDQQQAIPSSCPECHSTALQYMGVGTERSATTLEKLFPDRQIFRIDKDTTSRKNSWHNMLEQIQRGEPAILVGTQMLAKGHHFPNVTLVAILDADTGLFSPDFRGPEKIAQLLTQVAGRAGRAKKPGQVIIQTHHHDHPILAGLINGGFENLALKLMAEREAAGLPPYSHIAMLKADAKQAEPALSFLTATRQQLADLTAANNLSNNVDVIGPLPAAIEKKSNRYHYQLLLQCSNRQVLQRLLHQLVAIMENHALAKSVRWSIDVDPMDTF